MNHVVALWRYPVKSMQGELLTTADIGAQGIVGDRGWAIVDDDTGLALTGRRQPELLYASAQLVDNNLVRITLPDGSIASDNTALSDWLGHAVTLTRATAITSGTFEIGLAEDDDADHDPDAVWVQWEGPVGSFHDSTRAQISILGTTTLGTWDVRRFRPNVVVEGGDEDAWVGTDVQMGGATVAVVEAIDRCVITTRAQPGGLDRDLEALRTINATRSGKLGVGAMVTTTGRVTLGDPIIPI